MVKNHFMFVVLIVVKELGVVVTESSVTVNHMVCIEHQKL